MPHCLITGATGFIGPRLASVLREAGGDVSCLVRETSDTSRLEPLGVRLVEGDVTQPQSLATAVDGVDFVFHLAGCTFARRYEQFAAVNDTGTDNVAAACAAMANPPVLVAVSSLAAVGPSPPGGAVRESDPPEPISHYGRSKLAGEIAVRRVAGHLPASIVRPPVVFGPGDRAGLVLVRSLMKTGVHVVHRPGLPLSLVYVDDLARGLLLVARHGERVDPTSPRGRGLYHIADPAVSSYTEMGRMIAAALGRRVRVLKLRKWAITLAAVVGETAGAVAGRPSPLNLDKVREGTATGWVSATDKVTSHMNFAPNESLAERYRETIDWYRTEGWV